MSSAVPSELRAIQSSSPNTVTRLGGRVAARAAHERAGARRVTVGEVLSREQLRSFAIAADREPELGGVVGERVWVAREQFVIASFNFVAPDLCLLRVAGVTQDAGELHRVIGIVGRQRERPKAGDGGRALSQGRVEFCDVALRGGVGRKPAY